MKCCWIILMFICIPAPRVLAQFQQAVLGINICGGEFGDDRLPGVYNRDYTYPSEFEIQYFAEKGFKIINIPFRWERVQENLGGELNYQELVRLKQVVKFCQKYNVNPLLSMHNYGRYKQANRDIIVGSKELNASLFANFWKQMSEVFNDSLYNIGFGLMTEPYEMKPYHWSQTIQMVIDSIRHYNKTAYLVIDGDGWAYSGDWEKMNDDLANIIDPVDRIVFDAHCYFDKDHSGNYLQMERDEILDDSIGIKRVQPFVNWLKRNHKNGMIGEFGVPGYSSKLGKVMDCFLEYVMANGLTCNYWAAGKWWPNNSLSITPFRQSEEKPQLCILRPYLFQKNWITGKL